MKSRAISRLLLALLLLALVSDSAQASRRFALGARSVSLDVPADWQVLEKYLGVPLMMMGPGSGGAGRLVIAVTPMGKKAQTFDRSELERSQKDYQLGREAWLARKGGRSLAFLPHELETWPAGEVSHIGIRYRLGGEDYLDQTFYVLCKGELYHLSTLVRASQESQYGSSISAALRSFRCE